MTGGDEETNQLRFNYEAQQKEIVAARAALLTAEIELISAVARLADVRKGQTAAIDAELNAALNLAREQFEQEFQRRQLEQLAADVTTGNLTGDAIKTRHQERLAKSKKAWEVHLEAVQPRVTDQVKQTLQDKLGALVTGLESSVAARKNALGRQESDVEKSMAPSRDTTVEIGLLTAEINV